MAAKLVGFILRLFSSSQIIISAGLKPYLRFDKNTRLAMLERARLLKSQLTVRVVGLKI